MYDINRMRAQKKAKLGTQEKKKKIKKDKI